MDRSSSTPRLTLKFHHVKRHENGVAAAADISRLQSGTDGTTQLPAGVSAGGKTNCSMSHVDSPYMTSCSLDSRYHRADVTAENHQVLKNSLEHTQNNMSSEQSCAAMSSSPQFEDISDAEDEARPATVNSRESVCPAYSLPPFASQCLPPLSSGLYRSTASSTFCTSTAVTVSSSCLPIVGWNNYSGYSPQTAMTLLAPTATAKQSSTGRMLPWADENHTQMAVINNLSPVMSGAGSNGAVQTADAQRLHMPAKQPFLSDRFVASDGTGCFKSEFFPVKSEVLQNDKAVDHQTSFKMQNYNGHVGDVKGNMYIKAEPPVSHADTSQDRCPTSFENKLSFLASRPKSEEMTFSNSSIFRESQRMHEDSKHYQKIDSCDSEPNLHNGLRIKRDIDSSLPSPYNSCHHSPAWSISPSLPASCLEPGVAVNSVAPSSQVSADVSQITNLEPKVPPLRIIIPSKVCSSGALSDGSNTNAASRCSVGSLPYVVSRTHSADSDVVNVTTDEVQRSDSSPAVFVFSDNDRLSSAKEASATAELVPAKRRKMKHSSKVSVHVYVHV